MTTKTIWGSINADGSIHSTSGGFSISRQGSGRYVISFSPAFQNTPAIVGSQTRFDDITQWPTDNVVFPFVTAGSATAVTGSSDPSNQSDRPFSFIATGAA